MCAAFRYPSLEALYSRCPALPLRGDTAILAKPVTVANRTIKNAIAIQPMEGCDGTIDGSPTDWTLRRYRRFSAGGAGLLWAEAISVVPEGRANPCQLMITPQNVDEFKRLVDAVREEALQRNEQPPVFIAQLTHSGRFSRPEKEKAPIRAWTSSVLDAHQGLPESYPVASDAYLASLPERFAAATRLARSAGFDGVDVKACHLYLFSELLSAYDRPGRYGGSLMNRTRLFFEAVDAAASELSGGIMASRINVFDAAASPWGANQQGEMDVTEPEWMSRQLCAKGVSLLNITMGTPYYNPHINRPYTTGGYQPPEDPLEGVARLLRGCAVIQKAVPDAACLATGFSYLRQFAPAIAAGMAQRGEARLFGFGRAAFAYPDLARDIVEKGGMAREKCCVTCSICTKIMRQDTGRPGCPVRDTDWYLPEYRRVMR